MKITPIRRFANAMLALAVAALTGCAAFDTSKPVAEQANQMRMGPESAPFRTITGFAGALRCMDNLMLDYGTSDLSVIVEDLNDQTKKVSAGTKDMLISAVSDMTRRSRAIRLVAYGQDSGNTVGFLFQALRREHFAVVPTYALRGSISQFDDALVRRNIDAGISYAPYLSLGYADLAQASVLGIDLTMLTTQDLSVVPGIASRNSVILFKKGKGYDGEAAYHKFGINYSLSTATQEGQAQALRTLVELATIELFGRLAKVPYWSCLGANPEDEGVVAEMRDWYDGMMANPVELVAYFQQQMRARRIYDGPVDGGVNPQIMEAVARYREVLGLSREPKLSFDFFKAYLNANHRELQSRAEPVPPEGQAATAAAPASAPPVVVAAAGASPAAVGAATNGRLALQIGALNNATRFGKGEAVQLAIRPSRNAHVYCYLQDENQTITRFFPNRFRRDSRVDASQGLQLPGAQRFEIRMNQRGAQETVSCFATERDVLTELASRGLPGGDFDPLRVATLEQIRDVFITVTGGVLAQEYFHVQPK